MIWTKNLIKFKTYKIRSFCDNVNCTLEMKIWKRFKLQKFIWPSFLVVFWLIAYLMPKKGIIILLIYNKWKNYKYVYKHYYSTYFRTKRTIFLQCIFGTYFESESPWQFFSMMRPHKCMKCQLINGKMERNVRGI